MNQRKSHKIPGQQLTRYIFECTMSVFYIVFAILFLFTELFIERINGTPRIALGILLGVYGLFRVYRVIKKIRIQEDDE